MVEQGQHIATRLGTHTPSAPIVGAADTHHSHRRLHEPVHCTVRGGLDEEMGTEPGIDSIAGGAAGMFLPPFVPVADYAATS